MADPGEGGAGWRASPRYFAQIGPTLKSPLNWLKFTKKNLKPRGPPLFSDPGSTTGNRVFDIRSLMWDEWSYPQLLLWGLSNPTIVEPCWSCLGVNPLHIQRTSVSRHYDICTTGLHLSYPKNGWFPTIVTLATFVPGSHYSLLYNYDQIYKVSM